MVSNSKYVYLKALAILCLSWLALAFPWLSGKATIPYDAKAHFQAQIQFLAQAIHNGDTPFWAPNVFAGSPQIADPQSMIFSPAILLALFDSNPSFWAVDVMMFIYILAGCIGILMFFKDRGWHSAGGIVAALAFGFGASASSRIQHFGQIHSLSLFAVTLWLLARALDRKSWFWGALSGLSAGMMVVEPDQVGFLGVVFLAGFVIHELLSSRNITQAALGSIRPLLAGSVAAILLASIPLLMTILFVESSNRPEIELSEAIGGSLHPASLLTSIVGDLFGAIDKTIKYWGPGSESWGEKGIYLAQNMGQLYVGILPAVAIVVFGLFTGDIFRRDIRYFTLAAIASTIYALGRFTPIFYFLYEYMPGVDLFRRPADATFMMGAFFAIIGGYIVHRVATHEGDFKKSSLVWMGGAALSIILVAAFVVSSTHGHLPEALRPLLLTLGFGTLSVAGLYSLKSSWLRASPVALSLLAAGFMTIDLTLNQGPNESTALSPKFYEALEPNSPNETILLIKDQLRIGAKPDRRDRVELVGLGFHWPNASLIHGFDHTLGYNPLRIAAVANATGATDLIADPSDRKFTPLFPSYRSLLADMLGLRLIICPIPIEKVDMKLKPGDLVPLGRTKDGFAYENPRALPRVLFATSWQLADFDDLTKTGKWPEFNPRDKVLLEVAPALDAPETAKPAKSRLAIESYRNGKIQVQVESDQAGFLVLNDSYHPWWFANVDGQPVDVLKANVIFRAVQVPAGKHVVTFEFRPLDGAVSELKDMIMEPSEPDASTPLVDSQRTSKLN